MPPDPKPSPSRPLGVLGRRLLSAFLVVAVVPIAVTSGVGYWYSRDLAASLMAENVGKTARVYAAEVDDFLAEQRRLLGSLSVMASDDASLRRATGQSPFVEELLLLSATGERLAGSAAADPDGWTAVTCGALSNVDAAPMTHAGAGHGHEVVVAVPWGDGGRLCGRVSFTLHQDMLTERAQSAFGGVAYIVDRDGDVVCHAFEEDEPHVELGHHLDGPGGRIAAEGVPWFGTIGRGADRKLASYAPARTLPWGVWAEVPLSVAANSARPMLLRSLAFGGGLAVVLICVVWVLARRLASPIEELALAAKRIAGGRYGETVSVQSADEIGVLAQEFNTMSLAMRDAIGHLDETVALRTRELQQAREFSDTLLDTMKERILVIDPELKVIRANASALAAYGPEIVGCGCKEVHRRSGVGEPGCPAQQVFDSGEGSSEERLYERDGAIEILAVETHPVPGDDKPRAVVEIARDVTELKQFQAQLIHQEKMAAIGTLAAGLAHEIGNPLASLSSELELLEAAFDPDEARASLPVLRQQIQRISALLRELVDFGRRPREVAEVFGCREVLDEVVRLLRHDPRSKDVRVDVSGSETLTVCSNRDRLVQVLLNLGLNALDAANGDGRVLLSAEALGDGVRIEVSDDGPGIDPADRTRIFEPFFTTKPVGHGTGLGLFVSERVASGLGGRLSVDSSELGGARFVVELPACICPEEDHREAQ